MPGPSPKSCLPEAPNQDPGRRRSVGAQVMTWDLASLLLGQSWPLNHGILKSSNLRAYFAKDPKGERVYKLTTTIWSIHMNVILSSRFSLVFKSTWTFLFNFLRLTSSAATLNKRCCGFQATAVTGLPRSQQVSLQRVRRVDSGSICLYVVYQAHITFTYFIVWYTYEDCSSDTLGYIYI